MRFASDAENVYNRRWLLTAVTVRRVRKPLYTVTLLYFTLSNSQHRQQTVFMLVDNKTDST